MFSMTISWKKFEFERSVTKVKVIVAICRKNIVIALVPSFNIQYRYNFTHGLCACTVQAHKPCSISHIDSTLVTLKVKYH